MSPSLSSSFISLLVRQTVLTIPAVTVFLRVLGLPRAKTHSPGRSLVLLPNFSAGNFCLHLVSNLMSARSATWSTSMTVA